MFVWNCQAIQMSIFCNSRIFPSVSIPSNRYIFRRFCLKSETAVRNSLKEISTASLIQTSYEYSIYILGDYQEIRKIMSVL